VAVLDGRGFAGAAHGLRNEVVAARDRHRRITKSKSLFFPEIFPVFPLDRLLSLIYNLNNHLDSKMHQMEREEPHG
jgi:hypothetical protein